MDNLMPSRRLHKLREAYLMETERQNIRRQSKHFG